MTKTLPLVVGVALAAAVGTASGGIVSFEDDDLDFHLRPNAITGVLEAVAPDFVNGTSLQNGDVLLAVLEYNTANGVPFEPARELTGVAAFEANITAAGFDFVPYRNGFNAAVNDFLTPYNGRSINVTEGEPGGGTMIALWLDDTPDLDVDASLLNTAGGFSCSVLGECLDQATEDVIFEVDGFEGWDPNTQTSTDNSFWTAFGQPILGDPSAILNEPITTIAGFFNAGLSILDVGVSGADTNEPFVGVLGPIDVLLSGTINGGGYNEFVNIAQRDSLAADGFVATTDNQLQKSIPAPATLALLGTGLLGFSLSGRRRRA